MKKHLLSLIILSNLILLSSFTDAAERYWVGGSGSWDNSKHWSESSGGKAGALVPTENDNVIFDENSFKGPNEKITIQQAAYCLNFTLKHTNFSPIFEGASSLNISGSFILDASAQFKLESGIIFNSPLKGNKIKTWTNGLESDVIFDNKTGEWTVVDNLFLDSGKSISVNKGSLIAEKKYLKAESIYFDEKATGSINLDESIVILKNSIIWPESKKFFVSKKNTKIQVNGNSNNLRSARSDVTGFDYVIDSVSCNNEAEGINNDGVILITNIYGGTPPFLIKFEGGHLLASSFIGNPLENCIAQSYVVSILDSATGELLFQDFAVCLGPLPLGSNFLRQIPTCFGDCNGWVRANPIGGNGGYTYSWFDGQTTRTASNLCASSSINVTITDVKSCTKTFNTNLNQPQDIFPNVTSTNISCYSFCDGTASSSPTGGTGTIDGQTPAASPGGYTYSWSPNSETTSGITNLCPDTYTVTVTDDSLCTGVQSVIITEPDSLALNPVSSNVTCFGACDGTASVSPVGGTSPYIYTWTASVPGVFTGPSLTALCPGTYTVVVEDANGCSESATFVITEPDALLLTINGTNVICNSNCDGTATVTPSGGSGPFNMIWTDGSNNVLSNTNGLTSSINNLCPDTYTISVTDTNNCTVNGTITITEPDTLLANASSTDITCFGLCDGTATVTPTGGTSPFDMVWTDGSNNVLSNTNGLTASINNLCPDTYIISVTDANNCQAFDTVYVTEPPLLTVSVNDDEVSCSGACDGQLTANVNGGSGTYSYNWNSSPVQTTQTATGLCVDTYIVIVSDDNGCVASDTADVTNPTLIVPNVTVTNITCNGLCDGTATANPTGGTGPYTYLWDMIPNQIGQTAINLCANVAYTVTVTDALGCSQQETVTLTEPPPFASTASVVNVDCFDNCTGSISLTPSGATPPYDITWNTSPVQTGPMAINLCEGTYTATITDDMGCEYTHTETVTEPLVLEASASFTNVTCNDSCDGTAEAIATGGTGSYYYEWNTTPAQFTPIITGLCPGQYTVYITDDNGCLDSATVNITQPLALNASVTNASASCNTVCDGEATVSVGGGTPPYSYYWNTPIPQFTPTAINLCVGTYTITVLDANSCSIELSVQIDPLVKIDINSTGTGISCFGACDAQATATGFGGLSPYTYLWSNGDTGQTADSLCAGTATVTVTDANGCSHSADTLFVDPPAIALNFTNVNDAICGTTCNGSATASASGGTGSLTYEWNTTPIQTTATVNNLCQGFHVVTVTDQNNCSITDSVFIDAPMTIDPDPVVTDATCGNSDGEILLNTTGGTPPYLYEWSNGQTTNPATNLAADVYWVEITDDVLCVDTFYIIVNSISGPQLTTSTTPTSCNGACDGTASVVVNSGLAPYSYEWSSGSTTDFASNLCEGVQFITVTDANLCVTSVSDTVIEPTPILANASVTNVSCNGFCNGSIFLNPTGGNGGPYTFLWSNGSTSQLISNLCPGNYTVTITDVNGCTLNETINVGAATVINPNPQSTNIDCNGACNGIASVNPSGGQSPYSYSWFPTGPNGPSNTNLCPGSYQVTITDANGCNVNQSFTITEPAALTGTISKTDVDCYSACNGTASVTASGGSGSYTYFWVSTGQTTSSISNLCEGNYVVTICDQLSPNCCINLNINISEPALLTVNATGTDLLCNSVCSGTLDALASGGTGPYYYQWAPLGLSGSAQSGVCAGTHTVTVTDANGCSANASVVITEPAAIVLNPSSDNVSCFGVCDGSASVSPSGGTTPYTFLWSPNGETTSSLTNLCADSYSVLVTDGNGCTSTENFNITEPAEITATSTSTLATCGVCDGTATVSPAGGVGGPYTFLWDDALLQTTATASNLCAGLYNVTITDATLCSIVVSVPVSNAGGPTISYTSTDAICNGECNGTAEVSASGPNRPFTYLWTPTGVTDTIINNFCADTYYIEVTDALGCISFETIVINEPDPVEGNPTFTNESCANSCDGTITLNTTGGDGTSYTYTWSGGLPNTSTQTGLCSGTYTVQIEDGNGCLGNESVTIQLPNPLQVSGSSTNITCFGYNNGTGTVNISGGAAPYTVTWSTGSVVTTSGTATISGLAPGFYSAQVEDANGCGGSFSFTITEPFAITVNSTITQITCNGACNGSISLTISGGTGSYAINWSTGATGNTISNLCPGVYSYTVTDDNGCSTGNSFTITQPSLLTASAGGSNISCYGACDGTGLITPTGGTAPYYYLWSPGGYTSANPSGLCADDYTITVTDSNGCSFNTALTLTQPAAIVDNYTVTSPPCNICNGEATVSPTGGSGAPYDILWSDGQTTNPAVNLCAGMYTVDITDNSGCMQTFSIPISNANAQDVTVDITNATCNGNCDGSAVLTVTGGTPSYTYSWSPSVSTSDTAKNLCSGTYYATIEDATGCLVVETIDITESTAIIANASSTTAECGVCDGTASVAPTGGVGPYIFQWSNNATTSSITGLCAGIYSVLITDVNGCSVTETVSVANTNGPSSASQTTTNESCYGMQDGSAEVFPVGGTAPYSYQWIPGGQTTSLINNLSGGVYEVQIMDANGCILNVSVTVNGPSEIIANPSFVEPDCGASNGEISLAPSGGAAPYSYLWAGGQTSSALTGLGAGLYPVTITDDMGCSKNDTIALSNTNGPVIALSSTDIDCNGSCNGTISSSVSNGSGSYSYSWNNGATSPNISSLCAGSYTLTVTDNVLGCISFATVSISEPSSIVFGFPSSTGVSCLSNCDGTAAIYPTGGALPYSYSWNFGAQTTQTATGLCSGNNIVTITDANGCMAGQTVVIGTQPSFTATTTTTNATCGECDGSATVTVVGGAGTYTYLWSNNETTATVANLCAGVYSVEITDANGCSQMINVNVSNSGGPTSADISLTDVTCFGLSDGSASVNSVTGGTAPNTYLWLPDGQTTSSINNLTAGSYSLEVTDANGCKLLAPVEINQPSQILVNSVITNSACGICDGSVNLITSGGIGPYSYNWTAGGQTTSSLSGLCAGLYNVIITDNGNGCSDTLNVPVSNITGPTVNVTSTGVDCFGVCSGTATATASGGSGTYNYSWTPVPSTNDVAINLCSGTHFVEVLDAVSGCITIMSTTITSPSQLSLSSPNVIDVSCGGSCNGVASVIASGGVLPYSYNWGGATNTSLCAGSYAVTVTDFNGCTASQNLAVNEPVPIEIDVLSIVDPSCSNVNDGSIDISISGGSSPYTIQWSGGSSATTTNINNLFVGQYTVTVTDQMGCTKDTSITLNPVLQIFALATGDTTYCEGNGPVTIMGTGGNTYTWYSLPDMTVISKDSIIQVNPGVGANNYLLAAEVGPCVAYDTLTVNVNAAPLADAGEEVSIISGTGATIGGSPTSASGNSFMWSPSENIDGALLANPYATPPTSTTYHVTVTDPNGCISEDSVLVYVVPTILFPNGITPNGDGLNDTWIIDNVSFFPGSIVEVYNRWGELLFRSDPGYTNPWNGTFNGKELPVGTYYYVIDLHDERFEPLTGPITIMR